MREYSESISKVSALARGAGIRVLLLLMAIALLVPALTGIATANSEMSTGSGAINSTRAGSNADQSASDRPGNTGFELWYYYVGNLVNSANGNVYLSETDLSLKARGFDLQIVRSYNSLNSGEVSPFGFGWTFNYNIMLKESTDGSSVILFEGDGSEHTFTSLGGGAYDAPPGVHSRLVKNPEGTFTLWFKDGGQYNFDSAGTILNMVDKNGNHLSFSYTGDNLTSISDDSGLALMLTYDAGNRITVVTDPIGRQITYDYEAGDLVKVTDAAGKSALYSYYDNHKMESSVDRANSALLFSYYSDVGLLDAVRTVKKALYDRGTKSYPAQVTLYTLSYGDSQTTVTDAEGNSTSVALNASGNPIQVVDAVQGNSAMTWDADCNLTSSTDTAGRVSTFEYDACGNLTACTDAEGNRETVQWQITDSPMQYLCVITGRTDTRGATTQSGYDSKGNLTSTTDALGHISSLAYNQFGYATASTDPMGAQTLYSYDEHGWLLTTTDAAANTTTYAHDGVGRVTTTTSASGASTSYQYDAGDRVIKVTDGLGKETRYTYNPVGTLLTMTDAQGNQTSYGSNILGKQSSSTDALGNTTSRVYDTRGNLIKVTDARGNTTSRTYDDLNRLISVTDALGNSESYTYDAAGNRLTVTDARGNVTRYTYDALNRPVSTTDPLGNTERRTYDAAGNLLTLTDTRGGVTSYTYDALNRVISTTDPLGNSKSYTYDVAGNLFTVTDAGGGVTSYAYDALNRLISVTDALGNSESYTYDAAGNRLTVTDARGGVTSYTYDALNRVISTTDPLGNTSSNTYDAAGNITTVTDARGGVTLLTYDALNRLLSTTDPLGNSERRTYDAAGNLLTITDAEGSVTRYTYDALNRLVYLTDALGNTQRCTYDAAGNVLTITDANGRTTICSYDALNRRISATDPLGNTERCTYDAAGNVLTITDANGCTTTSTYDALNRPLSTSDSTGYSTNWTYDALGNLLSVRDSAGYSTTYEHDALGRILACALDYGVFTKTSSYTYDAKGNRATMTDPDGGTTTYTYDAGNRLVCIADPLGGVTTYSYDPMGTRTQVQYPNGMAAEYSYDGAGRLTSLVNRLASGDVLSSYAYTYDSLGNRLSMTEANGDTTRYQYDSLSRLTRVIYPSGDQVNYTYDPVGNRLSQSGSTSTSYTYDAANRLLTAGAISYSYDAKGNLIGKTEGAGATLYQYDAQNRLTAVTLPDGQQISYRYAPTGERISRTDSAGTTYYLNDRDDLLMELDAAGMQIARFLQGPGIDDPIGMVRGSTFYYATDGLGSVTSLTDSNGTIAASYRYDAFGAVQSQSGTVSNPYLFTGREYDPATALYYYRARYYDPATGRFTSADPVAPNPAEPQSFNRYSYCSNSPVNNVDPSGNWGCHIGGWTIGDGGGDWETGSMWGDIGQQFRGMGEVFLGYGDAVYSAGAGLEQLVCHFPTTVKGLHYAVDHPGDTWNAIKEDYSTRAQSNRGLGSIWGEVLLTVLTVGAPFAEGGAAGKAGEVAGTVEKAGAVVPEGATGVAGTVGKIIRVPIRITEEGWNHVLERHTINGIAKWAGRSKFYRVEDIEGLIKLGDEVPAVESGLYYERVVYVGEDIGYDAIANRPTSVMTIVTKADGSLETAYPGFPDSYYKAGTAYRFYEAGTAAGAASASASSGLGMAGLLGACAPYGLSGTALLGLLTSIAVGNAYGGSVGADIASIIGIALSRPRARFWASSPSESIGGQAKILGDSGWNRWGSTSARQTSDGGYIIVAPRGDGSVGLMKTDSSMNEQWVKTFRHSAHDTPSCVQQTSDGGYIIVGCYIDDPTQTAQMWLMKTDSDGNQVWDRTLCPGRGARVLQASDGGYIVLGYMVWDTIGGMWLIRTDASGNVIQWGFLGGEVGDPTSLEQTSDGGYIIAGNQSSSNNHRTFLTKVDSQFNVEWTKMSTSSSFCSVGSARETSDGGYIIAEGCQAPTWQGYWGALLIKTDSFGNELWHTWWGLPDEGEYDVSALETPDGGYLVLAFSAGYQGANPSTYLIRTDSKGNELWGCQPEDYSGDRGFTYYPYDLNETPDGGYIASGTAYIGTSETGKLWLMKVSDKAKVCVGNTIQFSNSSTGGVPPLSYSWDFGDGCSSTEQNPTHAYSAPGAYTVTLQVTDSLHKTDTYTKVGYVTVMPLLQADFSADRTEVLEGDTTPIQFTASVTGGVPPLSYYWYFGDSRGTAGENPTETYLSEGTYTVELHVTDAVGNTAVETKTDYITVASRLQGHYSADKTVVVVGQDVHFTSAATGLFPPFTYEWSFGSTEQNPTYAFSAPGFYDPVLRITDSGGYSENVYKSGDYILVCPLPQADFTANTTGFAGEAIHFYNMSTGGMGPLSYRWDFGDGGTSSEGYPAHIYNTPGTYTVSLQVTDPDGNTNTKTQIGYITIQPAPHLWMNPSIVSVTLPPGGATDAALTIGNSGGSELQFGLYPTYGSASNDPSEGTAVDIQRVIAALAPWDICFTIETYATSSEGNYILWLDTDQNPTTGITESLRPGYGLNDIGADYAVVVDSTQREAQLLYWDGEALVPVTVEGVQVPVTVDAHRIDVSIPRYAVNCYGDPMDVVVVAMDNDGVPVDIVPDLGHSTVELVVETLPDEGPSTVRLVEAPWLHVSPRYATLLPGQQIILAVNVDTSTLNIGEYYAIIDVWSTDPNNSRRSILVVLNVAPGGPIASFTYTPDTPAEGQEILFDASGSYEPGSSIVSWHWDFGDGTTADVQSVTHTYASNGTYIVTLSVADTNGTLGSTTRIIRVSNVEPIVDAGPDQTVNEGDTVAFSGSFTDPGSGTHTIEWDFGDGSTATGTLTPTHVYADNGVYTVYLLVSDNEGGVGEGTLTVTVNNVAPTVDAGPDATVNNGSTFTGSGSFTDPGDDTWTSTVDYGDGSGTQPLTLNADKTFSLSHFYVDKGSYTVTVTVNDNDGDVGLDTLTITVRSPNVAPTVEAGPDQTADEGSIVTFSGSFTDPDSSTHTITWNFGDGSSATGTLTPSHAYATIGTYIVQLTVTDNDGGVGTDTMTVSINNTPVGTNVTVVAVDPNTGAPTPVSLSFSEVTAPGDTTVTISSAGPELPSSLQLGNPPTYFDITTTAAYTAPIEISINYSGISFGGDESDLRLLHYNGSAWEDVTILPVDTANKIIRGQVTSLSPFAIVEPVNQPPAAEAGADQTVDEGSVVTFSGSFTDPDSNTHTITWSFGDGSSASGTLTPTHAYADNGTYTVTLTVTDNDGGVGVDTLTVTVNNVPPTAEAGPNQTVNQRDTVSFSGSFTDPGSLDTHTISWNFGDGSTTSGTLTPTHVYTTSGTYTVTLTVTDDDGGIGTDTLTVTVRSTQATITFNFVDQNGSLVGTGNERIYVDNYGWKAKGDQITVAPGTTIYYRAYYSQGSGLYGPKLSYLCSQTSTLNVQFRTITMDFQDQNGELAGRGTGNEQVYIDNVGYKANAQTATVPLNSAVYYRAYFSNGSGLYGPKYSINVDGSTSSLVVLYRTITMDFQDQNGELAGRGTGNERVYIDNIGYKANGETSTVPLSSAVYYRAYFSSGSGLYGPKNSINVDGSTNSLVVLYRTITMDFQDQNGELAGRGTGNEKVYIDNVGYKANAETTTVPLSSAVYYRAYFSQGSGLYGPKNSINVDGSTSGLVVMYRTITMDFQDQNGELAGRGTGNEKVYIDNVGYKANGQTVTVPLESTIYHHAYFAQGSGLYGPKLSKYVDSNVSALLVQFRTISFEIVDPVTHNLVSGAQVYVDNVGYVTNGGSIVVPAGCTVYHKANVGSAWSSKTSKDVDGSWTTCIYQWDGAVFNNPSYS